MSLTSYRAAPPRAKSAMAFVGLALNVIVREIRVFLTRFGGDLLSHALRRSTIGAVALNGRVRNGAGCFAHAITTKPRKKHAVTCMTATPTNGAKERDACFQVSTPEVMLIGP